MRLYNPPPDKELPILFRDDDFIVLDKPSGLLSVPGRQEIHKDSLATRVQLRFPDATVVHRLDMDTSGIMVMALNKAAHRHISRQFEQKTLRKEYEALVWGIPQYQSGRIDLPMRCDWENRPRQIVDFEQGKKAITDWALKAVENHISRVTLYPITGRSHQLRVHLKELGHPILGDPFYADEKGVAAADRLLLHAHKLTFHHLKDDQEVNIISPVPF